MIAGGIATLPVYGVIKCCLHFNPACKPEIENNVNEKAGLTENKKAIKQEKTKLITVNEEKSESYGKILTSSYGNNHQLKKDSSFSPSQEAYETFAIGL